jgi:2-phosphosulfolactate phosphatase
MQKSVVIDCFPDRLRYYSEGYAIVAIDVIRATSTAVTAVAMGRKCYPVPSVETAFRLAATLERPLLVGEIGGEMPDGFDMNNSPAELARQDFSRPVILLSSSGTKLLHYASRCEAAYLACLRNYEALGKYLAGRYPRIAVIGAGSRGEFREEDQMCCAWVADALLRSGYGSRDSRTVQIVECWRGLSPNAWINGKSAAYLRRTGQTQDLDFILHNINDLTDVYKLISNGENYSEVIRIPVAKAESDSTAA